MGAPQSGHNKGPDVSGHPSYAQQQAGFAPYAYASSAAPTQDPYVPHPVDTDLIVKGFEFNTQSLRRGFIRKVYSILSVIINKSLGLFNKSHFE